MKKHITLVLLFVSAIFYSQNTPGIYVIENVKINTKHSDFGTAFFGKNKIIFTAPKKGFKKAKTVWEFNDKPFLDLYTGEINEKGEIVRKRKMPGEINSKYNEGVVTFTKDLKTIYFSSNNHVKKKYITDSTGTNNIQIFKAIIDENGDWSNLIRLPFNGLNFSTGHPTLNADDTKLYFISDRPESLGKTDIFVVDILKNGISYSKPRNLGTKINTEKSEMFPFISDDNILYFSSDGHPGNGGLDVFASKIFDNTVSDPISLGTPVNGKKDDFAYIINDVKHKGYFSSNRKGGKGDDDIYSFSVSPPIHIECKQVISGVVKDINTQEILPGVHIVLFDEQGIKLQSFISKTDDASFSFEQNCDSSYKIVGTLEGYLPETIEIKSLNDLDLPPLKISMSLRRDKVIVVDKNIEQNKVISGVVRDQNTQKILPGAIVALFDKNGNELQTTVSNKDDASFSFDQPYDNSYKIEVSLKGYLKQEVEINTLKDSEDLTLHEISMNLHPDKVMAIHTKNTLNINTIYFDFDKYNIRSDAEFELDKIAEFMKQRPDIKIDISSHADSRGTNAYNLKLSDNRAKSTIQYLVNKGISHIRISGKGYGEVQLSENCPSGVPCNEYQHQLNRRSEFLVTNDSGDITFKSDNILFSNNFDNNTVAYTVQVGAFHGKIQSKKYKELTNLFNHQYDDGFNRYFAGKFKNSNQAKKYMSLLREKGFNGAFVVGLKGANRF